MKPRWLQTATEIALVLIILALLIAIWLPALIQAHPNSIYWP